MSDWATATKYICSKQEKPHFFSCFDLIRKHRNKQTKIDRRRSSSCVVRSVVFWRQLWRSMVSLFDFVFLRMICVFIFYFSCQSGLKCFSNNYCCASGLVSVKILNYYFCFRISIIFYDLNLLVFVDRCANSHAERYSSIMHIWFFVFCFKK